MAQQGTPEQGPEAVARRSADRLAVALEEVGFDVGRAFPMLCGGIGRDGAAVVELGQVSAGVADGLSMVLARAAGQGTGHAG